MEIAPRGATISVLMTWAPLITRFCTHIGPVMPKAFFRQSRSGRKEPRSPAMARFRLRTSRKYIISIATMVSASPVPMAAPRTPIPAPGSVTLAPNNRTSLVGKISRKLKSTSSTHMRILSMLGSFISPGCRVSGPLPSGGRGKDCARRRSFALRPRRSVTPYPSR